MTVKMWFIFVTHFLVTYIHVMYVYLCVRYHGTVLSHRILIHGDIVFVSSLRCRRIQT